MEHFGKLPLYVSAVIVFVSLIEAVVLSRKNRSTAMPFAWYEVWISLFDLVGRKLLALLPLSLATPVFALAWDHRLFTVSINSALMVFALFIGQEFCYYWYHRASHRMRFFWATHAVHHSPNQLTLSTAYRLGVTGKLTGSAIFFTPLVFLGVRPEVVLLTLYMNLMYQFWLHTTWVPKLGWLEYVFNTPSAHRVHHASNVEYLDANYGGVLIIFDRLFGTYVEERADEPCRYGLVTPTTSRNPFVVEFEHWATLIRDVVTAKSVWIAINHVIQPPGWLPDGGGETTEELRRKSKPVRGEVETVNG
ncbi:sterol desaturase family protein [Paraburkholderia caribensis]|uniref:sterol desaturase family protein n=1 Tax=Paraburkholderia caribensis TaxID=75105 RepID=UPI0028651D09|nr:sterol desaturase family protein [Paraburkholderia caribensis]MDR6385420.1 sterol desaturase/sphingolipid hydroxylase (fatty acid hydroxylase superfamily) [Paraburkholderia caribensis]